MKYYKDNNNIVYAYDLDGSQNDFIGDKIAMTDTEVKEHLNPTLTLAQVQAKQKSLIETAYQTAITAPIAYMSASFQADDASQDILVKVLLGMQVVGATPTGFVWMDANNVAVPMTLADLQGLYGAILTRGQAEFTKKIIAKQAVDVATTVAAVQAVTL